MKLDHAFFHVNQIWQTSNMLLGKSSEDQKKIFTENWKVFVPNLSEKQKKKRSSPEIEESLSPKSREDQKGPNIIQRSDADHSSIIGGNAEVDHSQIIGGMQSNRWGGYIPPGHLCREGWRLNLELLPTPPPPPAILRKSGQWSKKMKNHIMLYFLEINTYHPNSVHAEVTKNQRHVFPS